MSHPEARELDYPPSLDEAMAGIANGWDLVAGAVIAVAEARRQVLHHSGDED
jgi:hypothetical protein